VVDDAILSVTFSMHRILSNEFFVSLLTVVSITGVEGTKSVTLQRSPDFMELYIENSHCTLKVTLTSDEADYVARMKKRDMELRFGAIEPCIDPRTNEDFQIANASSPPSSEVDDVLEAIYTDNRMRCFNGNSSITIGEYVCNERCDDRYNPSKYTASMRGIIKRAFSNLLGLRNEIQLDSTTDQAVTGRIARKYCYNVAHRANRVKNLIYEQIPANANDSELAISIRVHTRDMMMTKQLDSQWKINTAEYTEEVNGEKYALQPIAYTNNSVIFGALSQDGSRSRVFKYSKNCAGLPDPLEFEFRIMNTVGAPHPEIAGFVAPIPYAYALSGTVEISGMIGNAKLGSESLQHEEKVPSCFSQSSIFLRGIEEDYVGIDIVEHFNRLLGLEPLDERQYMIEAIAMTRRMLGLMWRFHDLGFIHGDFHNGNGAFKEKKAEGEMYSALTDEMVLIDFGYAQFIPNGLRTNERLQREPDLNASLLSPWHLEGFRIGRRDDLYRVLETTAFLLALIGDGNTDIASDFRAVWNSGRIPMPHHERDRNLIPMKQNFFDSDVYENGGIYCCPDSESRIFPPEAIAHMKNAMDIILAMTYPDQRPKYEEIIQEVDMALLSFFREADAGEKAGLTDALR